MAKFSTYYFLKTTKKNAAGEAPLYARLTLDYNSKEVSLKEKVKISDWDTLTRKYKGNSITAQTVNNKISLFEAEIQKRKIFLEVTENLTIDSLIQPEQDDHQRTLLKGFEEFLSFKQKAIGIDLDIKRHSRYKDVDLKLKLFLEYNRLTPNFKIAKIDMQFIEEFRFFLSNSKNAEGHVIYKLGHNAKMGILKILKSYLKFCENKKWLKLSPMTEYKTAEVFVERVYLTEEEIFKLLKLDIDKSPELKKPLLYFLFGCFTGLSYIDIATIKKENIIDLNGKTWIEIYRKKTKNKSRIPFLEITERILEKIKQLNNDSDYLFPKISNSKLNQYLKIIAERADITKVLTCHVSRHTFSTLALEKGMSLESVAMALGHKDIRTTQIYAKMTDKKIGNEMAVMEKNINFMFRVD